MAFVVKMLTKPFPFPYSSLFRPDTGYSRVKKRGKNNQEHAPRVPREYLRHDRGRRRQDGKHDS
jgi:hypothetical protein